MSEAPRNSLNVTLPIDDSLESLYDYERRFLRAINRLNDEATNIRLHILSKEQEWYGLLQNREEENIAEENIPAENIAEENIAEENREEENRAEENREEENRAEENIAEENIEEENREEENREEENRAEENIAEENREEENREEENREEESITGEMVQLYLKKMKYEKKLLQNIRSINEGYVANKIDFIHGEIPTNLPKIARLEDIDRLSRQECITYLQGYEIPFRANSIFALKKKLADAIGYRRRGDLEYRWSRF